MKSTSTKVEEIEKRIVANERKEKRLHKQKCENDNERWRLYRELHKEKLKAFIGKPVKRKYRSSHHAFLNDAVGTLLEVNRTLCVVDFGEHRIWRLEISDVTWPEEEQGEVIELGGGL